MQPSEILTRNLPFVPLGLGWIWQIAPAPTNFRMKKLSLNNEAHTLYAFVSLSNYDEARGLTFPQFGPDALCL